MTPDDVIAKLRQWGSLKVGDYPPEAKPNEWGPPLSELLNVSADVIEELVSRLPKGMVHCTILFKECPVGHGRLIADNWIDDGCPYCKIAKLTINEEFRNMDEKMKMALK